MPNRFLVQRPPGTHSLGISIVHIDPVLNCIERRIMIALVRERDGKREPRGEMLGIDLDCLAERLNCFIFAFVFLLPDAQLKPVLGTLGISLDSGFGLENTL